MSMNKEIYNNGYQIFASDISLLEELRDSNTKINWNNINNDDLFWSENDKRYQVLEINHSDKYVILFR